VAAPRHLFNVSSNECTSIFARAWDAYMESAGHVQRLVVSAIGPFSRVYIPTIVVSPLSRERDSLWGDSVHFSCICLPGRVRAERYHIDSVTVIGCDLTAATGPFILSDCFLIKIKHTLQVLLIPREPIAQSSREEVLHVPVQAYHVPKQHFNLLFTSPPPQSIAPA
jgi:hypothetical protein